jgi:hypothetical protein
MAFPPPAGVSPKSGKMPFGFSTIRLTI